MKSGLLLFPPEEEAGSGGRIGSMGCGNQNQPLPTTRGRVWTKTLQGPRVWLLLCFPQWDVHENEKYLLSDIPDSAPLPSRVSLLTFDVWGFFFVCDLPSFMRAATLSVLFLLQLLEYHLSHS